MPGPRRGVPAPGAHGGDGLAVARHLGLDPATVIDLSMSLNPFAPELGPLLQRHLDAISRYPDPARATEALADAIGVDRDRLVLTNGGSEAIALVAAAIGGTVVAEPEFSLHPRRGSGPRWRSNPHSPTGLLAAADEHADVWDEAFYGLATGQWTRGDEGVVVVGSLTKVFACPGLRLGYIVADDVATLTAAQPEWPVNALALAVLPDLLATADLPTWATAVGTLRRQLADLLATHGLIVVAGDAPWVLTPTPGLRERLAPHGVVVRDCASFGLDGWARIAVPDDRGLERLAEVLPLLAPTDERPSGDE
ncbi:MAG TPA: aminotransferase class I/II-fold pyridoxal phosphate-dependent enzyme [Acidimicrobiales bacterium]|nr:aminotransferase class I/II-fold pyridoxal phosphate-dependent enzyme [Acidimicrobiales bacterium]